MPPSLGPVILSFEPTAGYPTTIVKIYGSNFLAVSSVQFNGVEGGVLQMGLEPSTVCQSAVPANATTGPITLVTPAGVAISAQSFVVLPWPLPVVSNFFPESGPTGTLVHFSGQYLVDVSAVKFNGASARFYEGPGPDVLSAYVPDQATSGPITIEMKQGTVTTTNWFQVQPRELKVEGFSPTSGPPGQRLNIWGQGIDRQSVVRVNGVVAPYVTSDIIHVGGGIVVRVPEAATTGLLTVETSYGSWTSSVPFEVEAPALPVIDRLSPGSGSIGDAVQIEGRNLKSVAWVRFNGVSTWFVEHSNGLLTWVPAGATTGSITVETAMGTAVSATAFQVNPYADIQITSVGPVDPVVVGQPVAFTVWVTNAGPAIQWSHEITNHIGFGSNLTYQAQSFQQMNLEVIDFRAPTLQAICTNLTFTAMEISGSHTYETNELNCFVSSSVADILALEPGNCVRIDLAFLAPERGYYHLLTTGGNYQTDPQVINNRALATARVVAFNELAIRSLGDGTIELSWPVAATNHVLQASNTPGPEGEWRDHHLTPARIRDRYVLTDSCGDGASYYRLIQR